MPEEEARAGAAGEHGEILVVDDEAVVLAGIRRVLEAEGWRVAVAEDARSALAHPAAATCWLVLCDLMLPDAPGEEVVRALRRDRPRLPVVMMTGYATAENTARLSEASASGFLAKPFDEAELVDIVERAAERRGAAAEERRS